MAIRAPDGANKTGEVACSNWASVANVWFWFWWFYVLIISWLSGNFFPFLSLSLSMVPLKVPLTLATPWRSSTWTSEWWMRFTTSSWTSTSASCPSLEATSTTSPSFVRMALVGFKHYLILPDMSLNLIQKLSLFVFVKGSSDKFEKLCEDSESRQEYCTNAYLYNITQGRKRTKWTRTSSIEKVWELDQVYCAWLNIGLVWLSIL